MNRIIELIVLIIITLIALLINVIIDIQAIMIPAIIVAFMLCPDGNQILRAFKKDED